MVEEELRAEDEVMQLHFGFRELVGKPALCSVGLGSTYAAYAALESLPMLPCSVDLCFE